MALRQVLGQGSLLIAPAFEAGGRMLTTIITCYSQSLMFRIEYPQTFHSSNGWRISSPEVKYRAQPLLVEVAVEGIPIVAKGALGYLEIQYL